MIILKEKSIVDIKSEINRNINKIKRTRYNRINLSERLKKYASRWKVITFIFNIEAVFLIVWNLNTNKVEPSLTSAFFAIYVILLQYFINEQNYNERSMKSHYHQLELSDLIIRLELLKLSILNRSENIDAVEEMEEIVNKYQISLKNNENHSQRDDLQNQLGKKVKNYKVHDLSLDQIFIILNLVISTFMLFYIAWIVYRGY